MTATTASDPDFPAAHSMDTTWFAVDRDGHVGMFDSGEPGAVPAVVDESIGPDDGLVVDILASLPPIAEPKFRLTAVFHPGFRPGVLPPRQGPAMRWPGPGDANLMLFRDESLLTAEVRQLPGLHVRSVGRLVYVAFMPNVIPAKDDPAWKLVKRFNEAAAQKGSSYVASISLIEQDLSVARCGVFLYRAHHVRFNIPEPYGQVLVPPRPLHLDEVPASLRDALATRVHLDVSFASSPYVQPAEFLLCLAWQDTGVYLAADGFTVRPLAGVDIADYRREAADLHHQPGHEPSYKPIVFDPPIDQEAR